MANVTMNSEEEEKSLKQTKEIFGKLQEEVEKVSRATLDITEQMGTMIEAKDSYTKGHSIRVAEYSAHLATALGWKEETVKNLLARTTRPTTMGGYSLGLSAPIEDSDNAWFGHGGAWGTNCMVNWHKRQLKLIAIQFCGGPRPWNKDREKAADEFFKTKIDNTGADAYTGRMK